MIDDASMDTKFDGFAKRDGATERRTDGATDTAAYWDAMDASKNVIGRWVWVIGRSARSGSVRVAPTFLS